MTEGDLRWKYNVGKSMRAGLIVDSNGVIYVGTLWVGGTAKIVAVNPDGTLKWEYNLRSTVISGLALSNDESVVYVGDNWPYLYAIYTATGDLKWEYTDANITAIGSGIAVDANNNIFFGTDNGPTLKSLAYDGTLRWDTADNYKENYCQVTVKNSSVVYCVTGSGLSQVQLSNGVIDWTYPAGGEGTGISIASDGTIHYGGGYEYEYAINPDGTLKWRYSLVNGAFRANAIGSNNHIWCTDDNGVNSKVVCLNPDGSLDWEYGIPNWIGEPWDTTGLALDSNDVVFIGCRDNNLYAINADGTLRWSYTAGNEIRSGIKFSPSEDTVYFGCIDGYLYAIEKVPTAPTCGIIAIGDKVMLCPIGNRHGNMVALKSGNAAVSHKSLIAPVNNQAALKLDFRNCKSKQGDKIICVPISGTKKNILGLR